MQIMLMVLAFSKFTSGFQLLQEVSSAETDNYSREGCNGWDDELMWGGCQGTTLVCLSGLWPAPSEKSDPIEHFLRNWDLCCFQTFLHVILFPWKLLGVVPLNFARCGIAGSVLCSLWLLPSPAVGQHLCSVLSLFTFQLCLHFAAPLPKGLQTCPFSLWLCRASC